MTCSSLVRTMTGVSPVPTVVAAVLIELNAQTFHACANPLADSRRVLADTAGEDKQVQTGAAMTDLAGLDVSLEETAICVIAETGRIVKETRAANAAMKTRPKKTAGRGRTGGRRVRIVLNGRNIGCWT